MCPDPGGKKKHNANWLDCCVERGGNHAKIVASCLYWAWRRWQHFGILTHDHITGSVFVQAVGDQIVHGFLVQSLESLILLDSHQASCPSLLLTNTDRNFLSACAMFPAEKHYQGRESAGGGIINDFNQLLQTCFVC